MSVNRKVFQSGSWVGPGGVSVTPPGHDWSDTNLPWAYTDKAQFVEGWPTFTKVAIQTASSDFWTNLNNTVNAASGRVVVELGEGVYTMSSFRPIGSSGDPKYAFGFWNGKLQGLLGQGPDKTFVEMAANSVSQAQLDSIAQMTRAAFAPLQMACMRIDGQNGSPILLGGITFRAYDQNPFTSVAADLTNYGLFFPQPCPHQGMSLYNSQYGAKLSYLRFQGFGRALTSIPPFEMANVTSQYGNVVYNNCESDGRLSPAVNSAKPRRCTVAMGNNAALDEWVDSWLHHSNVSRYAMNDQNRETQGIYRLTRTKIDHIADTQNKDPNINSGNSLGGWTYASCCGWESCNGTIEVTDSIIQQDDSSFSAGSIPQHFQMTTVGTRNPQGGRMHVKNTVFKNVFTDIDGYACFRIDKRTSWYKDGYATTLDVKGANNTPLQPHEYTGTWPPTAAYLAANGLSPSTHYIVNAL